VASSTGSPGAGGVSHSEKSCEARIAGELERTEQYFATVYRTLDNESARDNSGLTSWPVAATLRGPTAGGNTRCRIH
jgi:hypothetical protein